MARPCAPFAIVFSCKHKVIHMKRLFYVRFEGYLKVKVVVLLATNVEAADRVVKSLLRIIKALCYMRLF
jgi:hypothetical protein